MVTNTDNNWAVRLATLVLWLLAGGSVVYWGLRLSAPAQGVPLAAVAPALPAPDAQALARLLGAVDAQAPLAAPAASVASRFALVGVLAGRSSGAGAALIAVDSRPAKPYRVGAQVDAGLVLQSVGPRQARLGAALRSPTLVTLDVPARR
jgi:general secretion pathway protein C